MKKEVCKACNGKGTYIGQIPPGRSVKVYCFCEKGKEKMDNIKQIITMEDQTCQNPENKYVYKAKRKYYDFKYALYSSIHGLFWKTLFLLRLASHYSKFMCSRGWYRKYPDGRCQYCGNRHK